MIRATMAVSQDAKAYFSSIREKKDGSEGQLLNGRIFIQRATYTFIGLKCESTFKNSLLLNGGSGFSAIEYQTSFDIELPKTKTNLNQRLISKIIPSDKLILKPYYTIPKNKRAYCYAYTLNTIMDEHIPYCKDKTNNLQLVVI